MTEATTETNHPDGKTASTLAFPEKVVDSAAPWRDDIIGRAKYRDALKSAVETNAENENGVAILLDGGYGTGKTYILERWAQDLRNSEVPVRSYNAWQHDGDEDPLISLVECLTEKDSNAGHDLGAVAEDVAWQVAKLCTRVDLQAALDKGSGEDKSDLFKQVSERRQASRELREGLSMWPAQTDRQFAVVIIDELDRCRPAFALRVMERVKHVLRTPGVAFVFGASSVALSQAFLHEHGNGADAEGYFLRMFDHQIVLPAGVMFDEFDENAGKSYAQQLAKTLTLDDSVNAMPTMPTGLRYSGGRWSTIMLPMLGLLGSRGRMTPREMEKLMQSLATTIALAMSEGGQAPVLNPFVILPMLVARLKRLDAYHAMIAEPNQGAAVVDCFAELVAENRSASKPATTEDLVEDVVNLVERSIYHACRSVRNTKVPTPIDAITAIQAGKEPPPQSLKRLASRSRALSQGQADKLLKSAPWLDDPVEAGMMDFAGIRHWADRINMIRLRD